MCDHCMQHGAGGKWYLNAESYSNEVAEKYNLREFLLEQYLNFGVMSEIIDKLPRFIPEKEKYHLTREEAVARLKEHNAKGYIGTIWYGPYPYINNLCSCAVPECAGIRPRLDFELKSIHKGEYLVGLHEDGCCGCGACVDKCSFGALRMDKKLDRPVTDLEQCYGCGVCRHACPTDALFLIPRDEVPAYAGRY